MKFGARSPGCKSDPEEIRTPSASSASAQPFALRLQADEDFRLQSDRLIGFAIQRFRTQQSRALHWTHSQLRKHGQSNLFSSFFTHFSPSGLLKAYTVMSFCLNKPTLNRFTLKAQQLPIINPFTSMHGRVFFISWLSFMFSFMAWVSLRTQMAL